MPRKTDANGDKRSAEAKKERFNDAKFVNYELSDEQRKALKALPIWSEDWDSWLDRCSDEGYQISLKFDSYSRSFAAFMSIRTESHVNGGCILTGRGSTQIKALRQVLYKHWAIAEGEWNRLDRSLNNEIDD